MRQNNLQKLRDNIVKIFVIFLITSIAISAVLFLYVFNKNKKESELLFKTQLVTANKVLQYSIYNQIGVLLNNIEFISFISSGDLSRQRHYGNILLLCSNLDRNLFEGIEVVKFNPISKIGTNILNYGHTTEHFINLDICYLNNRANDNLGDCVYRHIRLKVYFNKAGYINQLNSIDPIIRRALDEKTVYKFYPFSDTLVDFKIKDSSKNPLPLWFQPDNKLNIDLFWLVIPLFSIILLVYYFSYKAIRKEVENKLIIPLNTISQQLKSGTSVPIKSSYLIELTNLIDIVNKYNTTQINSQLNKICARLAHDIKSPIAAIDLTVADILDNNNPNGKIIKSAIKSVRAIVNNMLQSYSSKFNSLSIFDETKSYALLTELLEEVIMLKTAEWSRFSRKFVINNDFDKLSNNWVYLSITEFKRHISNLLQNAYEAIRKDYIEILITTVNINNMTMVTIDDNGIGMNAGTLEHVKIGNSLKNDGHGIGLEHAIMYFNQEGGFNITSTLDAGITINLQLKTPNTPVWFTTIPRINKNVVIVDNEKSLLEFWVSRFTKLDLNINTFTSPDEFKLFYMNLPNDHKYTFMIDYDYNNDSINGLDLIHMIKNRENCHLITNNYGDYELQCKINSLHVKLIPKCLLSQITILIE
jgi:signal transduction histidine kinase